MTPFEIVSVSLMWIVTITIATIVFTKLINYLMFPAKPKPLPDIDLHALLMACDKERILDWDKRFYSLTGYVTDNLAMTGGSGLFWQWRFQVESRRSKVLAEKKYGAPRTMATVA